MVWVSGVGCLGVGAVGRGDRCCGGVEPATAGGGEWARLPMVVVPVALVLQSLVLVGAVADWVSRVLADWV